MTSKRQNIGRAVDERVKALEAENERLRAALQAILDSPFRSSPGPMGAIVLDSKMEDGARDALEH